VGDGIGAAAVGVGGDGLAVGKIKNGQERKNDQGDRSDVDQADRAQGQQNRQRGFGAIGGGGKPVQAERGDAGEDADLLLPLFRRGKRLAEQLVNNGLCRLAQCGPVPLRRFAEDYTH